MFSKDTAFRVSLGAMPEPLRNALRERSLDLPGVLVAYVEGVQEEGMAGGAFWGTSVGGMDPIVPIAVSALFSSGSGTVPASSASPSSAASLVFSPPFSFPLASSSAKRRKVEKSRVSGKKGKVSESASVVAAGGEEVVGGVVEEEAMENTAVSALVGTGGLVAERESGGCRVDAEPQHVNPAVLESAKTPLFHGWPAGNRTTPWWTEDCCKEVSETCS